MSRKKVKKKNKYKSDKLNDLGSKEQKLVDLIAEGKSVEDIMEITGSSIFEVFNAMQDLYDKLEVPSAKS